MSSPFRHCRRGLCGGALALTLLFAAAPSYAAVFYPETYTLANGMQIVIVQNRLSPAVGHMVWYKVGSVDDPQGRSGLAHYLEHMMFKGTETLPSGSFSKIIAAQGGEDNAYTTLDYTAYHEEVAATRLPLVMQMEADRMRHLRFDPHEAASELSVVLSERQERTENDPRGLFSEKLGATFYGAHPYGRPVIGWRSDLEQITPEDAQVFYDRHYTPANAVLVISGNVEISDVLRHAAATFGRLPSQKALQQKPLPRMEAPENKRVDMQDARVTQAFVNWRVALPDVQKTGARSMALEVLAEVLSSGEVGLLYRQFVHEKKSASGVTASYLSVTRGPALFSITGVPAPDQDVRLLEKQMKAYLSRLAHKGIAARDVQAAKQRLDDAAIFARDRLMAPAQILGAAIAVGQSIDDVENWPAHIRRVTTEEVNAALRDVLASPYEITGILEPATKDTAP